MATSYPGKHLHPVWRCERESLLLTHGTPGGARLELERLLRVREELLDQGLRGGSVGKGKASEWTLKDGRSWVCGQAAPTGRRVEVCLPERSPHTWSSGAVHGEGRWLLEGHG